MVWNIHFQIAGLAVLSLSAVMLFHQKRLKFKAERAFVKLLVMTLVCTVLDIASIAAINYQSVIGEDTCAAVCKIYLFSLSLVACQSAFFAVAEIRHSFKKVWTNLTLAPLVVEAFILCCYPLKYNVGDGSIYTSGIPVVFTYIVCGLYIFATFFTVAFLKDGITVKRRRTLYVWLLFCIVAAVIQLVFSHLLIVSFAMCISCMYMYCRLENPEYHVDFTTNVFNRKGFEVFLQEYLNSEEGRAVIAFSLNRMTTINEVFGTKSVDKLVSGMASFVEKIDDTTFFKLDDNLFSIIVDESSKTELVLDSLLSRFKMPWDIAGVTVESSISVAYIDSLERVKGIEELEEALYYFTKEAEKQGEGTVIYIDAAELANRKRSIELKRTLDWAFNNDGIEVYYQPIYNISEGKFDSMEALARVRDENGSILPPFDFIKYAEKNGMILKLGEIVFRKVCEFIQRMKIEEYGIEYIEVNLSVVQCMQDDMARTLKNVMAEYRVSPYRINFEITESAAANSRKALERNMNDLLKYGSGFSLDDYGSGYSNLAYVISLPLKIIKIDKLLVDHYFVSDKVKIATKSTIDMIHQLGMKVIVEGIETEEQYLEFKKLGVEFIQGFYFSKPLSRDKVLNFVQEWL